MRRNRMNATSLTVNFDDEQQLQDALAGKLIGSQGAHDDLQRNLQSGVEVIVCVAGMPLRTLTQKGSELVAEPRA